MKHRLVIPVVVLAIVAAWASMSATTLAHPTFTSACSGCHGSSSGTVVKLTLVSNTGPAATYNISVTSTGGGAVGWTVLNGSTNVARASASTGRFTVATGKTYTVWGNDTNSGANSVKLSPVPTLDPHLSRPGTPAALKKGKAFTVSGTMDKAAATRAVSLVVYRKVAGKWVLSFTRATKWTAYTSTQMKYVLAVSLPYAGTWRIGASYAGNTKYHSSYAYRDVTVAP